MVFTGRKPILSTTNKLDKIKRLKKKDINIKKDIFILSSEIFLSVLKIVLFIILLGLTSLIISKEVIFNKISTGALSDLEKVTKQARSMVTVYGLNDKIGNLTYYDSSGQNDYGFTKPYSDTTAQIIDKEISNIIETQFKRAIGLLKKHKKKLEELANYLLEKEVIFKEDLVRIFGERPFEEKISQEKK